MEIKHNASGVSLALAKTLASNEGNKPDINEKQNSEYTIKIANTLEDRERIFRLAYKVYKEKGYVKENTSQWLIEPYDANNETVIFIVQDKQKDIVGSATLVFDRSMRIPAEKSFEKEIKTLRNGKNQIAELSRLIICNEHRGAKDLLVLLFNYVAIYITVVKKYNCLVAQVNPRHKAFYSSLLKFDQIGEIKVCPSAQNAPAHLLYLTTEKYQIELQRLISATLFDKNDKSLFKFFLKPRQENLIAYYLERQAKPISEEEKIYFGLVVLENEIAMHI